MLKTLLFLCLSVSLAVAQPIVKGPQAAKIDSLLTNITPFGFSGALAVIKNGDLILKKAYGLADRTTGTKLTESTPFIIGSLSKQITAAAILKLETEGNLKVTDTLGRFWPDAPASTRGLTLHQLMSHSSGLPYFSTTSLMAQMPRDEKMKELLQLKPQFTPGSQFMYSNPGFTLLAGVIEKASGISFEEYLRTRFFTPMQMTETGFVAETARWQKLGPHSYSDGNHEGALGDWREGAEFAGAGNIISTIGDLYKWETALSTNTVLPDSSRAKLFTPHIPTQGKNGYGYGWNVNQTIRGTKVIAHAGDLGGYNSDFRRYVDEGYIVIFLSNAREGGRGYRDAAMNPASLILSGKDLPIAPTAVSLQNEVLDKLSGSYSSGSSRLDITRKDNAIIVSASDQASFNALAPGIPDSILTELSETTKRILDDLKKGEYASLRDNLSPSFPFEDSKTSFSAMLRSIDLGELKAIMINGSTFTPPMSGRTYFTLEFEKGVRHHSYAWSGGKIGGAKDEASQGVSMLFVPTSLVTFVNVEPFSGKQTLLSANNNTITINGITLSRSN
jgi:CubicO group peptidase (beta-lactamase class C family)